MKTVYFRFNNGVSTATGSFTFDTEEGALGFFNELKLDPRYVEVYLK
jgi:hypothetical protein